LAVSKHSRGSLTSPGYEPQRFRAVWITPPLNALAAPGTNRRDYSDSLCCEEFKKELKRKRNRLEGHERNGAGRGMVDGSALVGNRTVGRVDGRSEATINQLVG